MEVNMLKKIVIILFLCCLFIDVKAEDIDLFAERYQEVDKTLFKDYNRHKLRLPFSFIPFDENKIGLGYEYYFSKKYGVFLEGHSKLYNTQNNDIDEKVEINIAASYRFTPKAKNWVFFGDIGLSLNNDIEDEGELTGFTVNHLFGRLALEYIWDNGFGLDYSLEGRMPLSNAYIDDGVKESQSLTFIYQFNL